MSFCDATLFRVPIQHVGCLPAAVLWNTMMISHSGGTEEERFASIRNKFCQNYLLQWAEKIIQILTSPISLQRPNKMKYKTKL